MIAKKYEPLMDTNKAHLQAFFRLRQGLPRDKVKYD